MIKTPEKHEQPYGMMGLNSSSTPSTNTNIDLHSMPVSSLLPQPIMGGTRFPSREATCWASLEACSHLFSVFLQ